MPRGRYRLKEMTKDERREARRESRERRAAKREAERRRQEATRAYMHEMPYKVIPNGKKIAAIMRQRRKPGVPWAFCVVPRKKA